VGLVWVFQFNTLFLSDAFSITSSSFQAKVKTSNDAHVLHFQRLSTELHDTGNVIQEVASLPDATELAEVIATTPSMKVLLAQLVASGILIVALEPLEQILLPDVNTNGTNMSDRQVDASTSLLYGAIDSLGTAARINFGIMIVATIQYVSGSQLITGATGVSLLEEDSVAPLKIAFTIWVALTLSQAKSISFLQLVSGNKLGRVKLYDQLIDFLLAIATAAVVLDELNVDVGMGFQSVFAASGVGALIFSLASKDLASQIVAGIMVQAWDAFDENDDIKLGDGTIGTVQKIGLVETELIGGDNLVTTIPNSQLVTQRVSNITRAKQSQVVQMLRFSYDDLDKLPQLLSDIKLEIEASCPKLITDGSKPFTAMLTEYNEDHVRCSVDCHFVIQPSSLEYSINKEQVLLAIARAADKNSIKFAIPSIYYINSPPP